MIERRKKLWEILNKPRVLVEPEEIDKQIKRQVAQERAFARIKNKKMSEVLDDKPKKQD